MDQDITQGAAAGFAAQAFTELRGEVSLLRRAVERLTDERTSAPDYGPTLEAISKRLEEICDWVRKVSECPGIQVTPASLARDIEVAAAKARAQDRQTVEAAAGDMTAAGNRIDAMIARSRSAGEQNRELKQNRIAFAVAGMMLFAILPGAVARSMPVSWAMPERIASRMLGLDMWNAGEDMMAKADPQQWDGIAKRERERSLNARSNARLEK